MCMFLIHLIHLNTGTTISTTAFVLTLEVSDRQPVSDLFMKAKVCEQIEVAVARCQTSAVG